MQTTNQTWTIGKVLLNNPNNTCLIELFNGDIITINGSGDVEDTYIINNCFLTTKITPKTIEEIVI